MKKKEGIFAQCPHHSARDAAATDDSADDAEFVENVAAESRYCIDRPMKRKLVTVQQVLKCCLKSCSLALSPFVIRRENHRVSHPDEIWFDPQSNSLIFYTFVSSVLIR